MKHLVAIVALVIASALPALADPQSDVVNAMTAFGKLTSYHIDATAGKDRSMSADVVNPGRMHVTAGPAEMIQIDGTTYVKFGGSWRQFAIPGMERIFSPVTYTQKLAAHKADVTVTDLGTKVVAGAPLHAYLVKSGSVDRPATVYLDGTGALTRVETVDGTGNLDVITFSNFNGPISIVAPI